MMCEMRMYELECLRRRMEDQILASQQAAELLEAASSQVMSPLAGSSSGAGKKNGNVCSSELSPLSPTSDLEAEPSQEFSGISCLLITWKSNPEVEQFKVKHQSRFSLPNCLESKDFGSFQDYVFQDLYWSDLCKDMKKRTKLKRNLSEMVSEDSLKKHYRVLGKVS